MCVEKLLVNLIDLGKVVNVGNENIDLDNALPCSTRSLNDGLDIGQNLAGLDLYIFVSFNKLALGSERNLTRKVDKTIGLDGLAVRTNRSWSILGENLLR